MRKKWCTLVRNQIAVSLVTLSAAGLCQADVIFSDSFVTNAAAWNVEGEWQIGPARTSSGHSFGNPDPGSDHTSTSDNGIAGVVIGGNAHTSRHDYYYLSSPVVDVDGFDTVNLSFYRWLNSDQTPYMDNRIDVFDGSNWKTIWSSGSTAITDDRWNLHSFDISPYANRDLRVRFGFNIDSNGVHRVSSWNLDDVTISGFVIPEPSGVLLMSGLLVGFVARGRRRPCQSAKTLAR